MIRSRHGAMAYYMLTFSRLCVFGGFSGVDFQVFKGENRLDAIGRRSVRRGLHEGFMECRKGAVKS